MATRTETVRLKLDDAGFTSGMAKAAAQAALLRARLNELDGTNFQASRNTRTLADDLERVSKSSQRTSSDINQLTGRLTLMAQLAASLGPGLVPIGAVAVPAVATLAAGLGAAALAAGSAIVAFQGVGEATKALDEFNMAPTAENLEKAHEAMRQLGPDAREFTRAFQDFQPVLTGIRDSAAAGLFPGLTESLDNFERVGPRVASIFEEVGRASGNAVRDFSEDLAGPEYAEFLGFLETAAPAAITSMASSLGSLTHGITQVMMSLNPGIQGGFGWIEDVAAGFDRWASSAEGAKDIEGILAYVRETGPQVSALIGSLANAVGALAQAAAPLGGTALASLTALLNAFSALAASPLGTPLLAAAAAMATISRASTLANSAVGLLGGSFDKAGAGAHRAETTMSKFGRTANLAGVALAGFSVATALQNDFDGLDSGIGAVTRGLTDLSGATKGSGLPKDFDDIADSFKRLNDPGAVLEFQDSLESTFSKATGGLSELAFGVEDTGEKARAQFEALDQAFAGLVSSEGPEAAGAAFSQLAKDMGLSGAETQKLMGYLPAYKDALISAGSSATEAANGSNTLAQAEERQAAATQRAIAVMRAKVDATNSAFSVETSYREALKAARAQADNNNAGIKGNTDAALANRRAIEGLSNAWNGQSAAVRNNSNRYKTARGDFIAAAEGMGVTAAQARRLANTMLQLPKSRELKITASSVGATKSIDVFKNRLTSLPKNVSPKITADSIDATRKANAAKALMGQVNGLRPNPRINADASGAISGANAARSAINNVQGKTVTITTVYRDVRQGVSAAKSAQGLDHADGGYISGPGGPRDDLIPAMLSNGEYVVNAAATKRNLPLLHALNAEHYAVGGLVGEKQDILRETLVLASGGPVRRRPKPTSTRTEEVAA